jgi:diaminopimelate decarboxylase
VLRILAEEGLGCDVASAGELAIALAAGFDPARILLHGNAKSDQDIGDALAAGAGLIVIDNADDVGRLERLGADGQNVLIRVNPAVPGKTHAAVDTGSEEAKFGVSLDQAPALIERVKSLDGLELLGLHVHVGSQLLDLEGFDRAAQAIAALGHFPVYDLGGGLGIAYRPEEEAPSVGDYAEATVRALHEHLDPGARLIVEPGRSMVGRSGVTLYSVVTVKRGARTHVAVNGGMGDNLEPMLYGTRFAPAILDRERTPETCDLVGHHCESGDVLAPGVALATPEVGDLLLMPVTGAYCFSLMNNYNGARRPPVVLVGDGEARLAVRRERMIDLLARDVL